MKKRLIPVLLVFAMVLSLFPYLSVGAVDADTTSQIKGAAETLVKNYAATVKQPDAADEAFEDYFIHGFFKGGSDMILQESNPMVASLFNSGMMQEALVECIYRSIVIMQDLNLSGLCAMGESAWHNYGYSYSMNAYRGTEQNNEFRLGTVGSSKTLYGNAEGTTKAFYRGPTNRNDEVMELLVGGMRVEMLFSRGLVTDSTVTYTMDMKFYDDFDFDSDYSTIAKKGFNTSKDQRLKNLGVMMNVMGLDNFYWEYSKSFTIEVPYECDHSGNNYHWSYDGENHTLICDTANGFTEGTLERIEHTNSKGDASYYFKLDEPIVLRHDKPWVIEYNMKGVKNLAFSALSGSNYCYPSLIQYSRYNTWIYNYEVTELTEANGVADYNLHYVGVDMKDQFKYSSKHTYSFRIENKIAADSSNMIYVSVYDNDLGEIVYGPAAFSSHWIKAKGEKDRILLDESSNAANGLDFIINYIGNSNYRLTHNYLEIWIYENGEEAPETTRFRDSHTEATCTTSGGTTRTCVDCSYTYISEHEAAFGHSFGEYVYNNNANCTADGTKTAICTICGTKDTITAEGSATGHSYSESVTEPGCESQGYTTYNCFCGDSYIDAYTDAVGHSWGEGEMTKAPTVEADGETSFCCSVCGTTKTETIEKLMKNPFLDVNESDYFYTPVMWALKEGITSGLSETSFSPANGCTRAQAVTFLWRAAGEPKPAVTENPFKDVVEGQYFYDAVLWAVEQGITAGLSADIFGPNDDCNRSQIVTFLWRANGEPSPINNTNCFVDLPESHYSRNAVLWAVEKGITTGMGTDSFAPNVTCTRGQIATFLYRTYAG